MRTETSRTDGFVLGLDSKKIKVRLYIEKRKGKEKFEKKWKMKNLFIGKTRN